MVKTKEQLIAFFDGYLYPIFLGVVVFFCHTLSLEFLGLAIIFLSMTIALIICEDMRALIAPVCYVTFTISYKTFLSGTLGSTSFLVTAILCLSLFFGGSIYNIIANKKLHRLKELPKSKLFISICILSVTFLLNGFFAFKSYKGINIGFALLLVFFLLYMYCLFYLGLNEREDTVEYLIHILYVASIVLIAQMFVLITRDAVFDKGKLVKDTLIVGWGSWNNIGGMLTMLLPVHFYYAHTKKHGYIFYGTAVLSYIAIAFTLSRASLLFATLISIVCVILICIKGNNVKINRIITACGIFIALIGIIILWDKISLALSSYLVQNTSDNGRFALYKHGIENFLSHPIFGGGFGSCAEDYFGHGIEPNRYHNTIIEILATCGIVGFGAYVFHRYKSIKLIWNQKSNAPVICLALVILALLLTSMLDNHFFNLYPTMYYAIILCVLDKRCDEKLK